MSVEHQDMVEATQQAITDTTMSILSVLKEKNSRYGDQVVNPTKVFSTHALKFPDAASTFKRLDEKLGRITVSGEQGAELRKNDVFDLIGYLILLCVLFGWTDFSDQLD